MSQHIPKRTGIAKVWLLALVFSTIAMLVLGQFVSWAEALGRASLLLLPNLWLARLIVALNLGRMTRRFNFLVNVELEPTLVLSSARILERDSQSWAFWSNWIREAVMCLVVWILVGIAALAPLAEDLFGPLEDVFV